MKNKFIMLLLAIVASLSLTVAAEDSPSSKEYAVEQLNTVSNVTAPSVEGHVFTFTTSKSTVEVFDTISASLSGSQKIECLIDIVAMRDGELYSGACNNVTLDVSQFAMNGDKVDNFRALTITDGSLDAVEIVSYDEANKLLIVNMQHFSPLAVIRVNTPATGDVNTTPYWIAIGVCAVALGVVVIFGKKKKSL